jgi:dienelactone hydrolase
MKADAQARLQRYLDGEEAPGSFAELEEALRLDPALRKELLVLSEFEAELPGALREIASEASAAPPETRPPGESRAVSPAPVVLPLPAPRRFRPRPAWILWPAAVAAGAVIAIKLIAPSPRQAEKMLAKVDAPPSSVERVEEAVAPRQVREQASDKAVPFRVQAIPAGPVEGERAAQAAPAAAPMRAPARDAVVASARARPPVAAMRAMRTPLELDAPAQETAVPMAVRTPEAAQAAKSPPPATAAAGAPRLAALPQGPAADWPAQRAVLLERWRPLLGTFPAQRPPLKPVVVATEMLSNCTRRLVRYQVEEGVETDGYLLAPTNAAGPLPAVVVFHPTTPLHARGVAGASAEYPEEKRQGLHLAARGYVAWCPRNYIYADGTGMSGNVARVKARQPDWSGMGRMVWDAIRAADFIETLPEVDRRRIGCLGHSLGGKEVLFAMAFDERYRAGVSSEGGIGLTFSNWDAPWYLGPAIREPGFDLENHQVLALVAPRPFLLLAGESADGDRSRMILDAVRPVYERLGAPGNLAWLNHRQGHAYPPAGRAAAEAFLDRHLKAPAD